MSDVLAGVLRAADLFGRRLADDQRAELLERLGDEVLHPRGQHGQEPAEVLGVPGAGQVGLAEADQLVAAQPQEELLGTGDHHDRAAAAVGLVADVDGDVEPVDGGAEEGPGDARGEAGAGARRELVEARPVLGAEVDRGGRRGRSSLDSLLGWVGRGWIGSRRSHSQMPCIRIRSAPRMAAGAAGRRVVGTAPGQRGVERRHRRRWSRLTTMSSRSSCGHRDGEVVGAVGAVERRDVHRLGRGRPALLVGVDEVGVPVAVGVVHLHHGGRVPPARVPAPVHRDRVEAVAERARVGGHHHPAAAGGRCRARRGRPRRWRGWSRPGRPGGRGPRTARARRGRAGRRGRRARSASGG